MKRSLHSRVTVLALVALISAGACHRSERQSSPVSGGGSAPATSFQKQHDALAAAAGGPQASSAARGKFATFLHANDRLTEAAALYEQLRRDEPHEARWPYYLARIVHDEGQLERARALLDEAAARAPDRAIIVLRRADLLFKSGKPDEAAADYERHLRLVPASAHARLGLSRIAIQNREWEKAETFLQSAARDGSVLHSVHSLLATVHEARGETAKASRLRDAMPAGVRFSEPEDPWFDDLVEQCVDPEKLSVLADIALESGRTRRAIGLLERSLTLHPTSGRTRFELARAHLKNGQRPLALSLLAEAVRVDSKLADAHYLLVAELEATGELPRALAAADSAVQSNPQRAGLHRQRGILLQVAGRSPEAEAALDRAVAIDPADVQNLEALGNFHWAAGRREKAAVHFERARSLSRLAVKARAVLATHHLEHGRLPEAEACLQEAIEIEPGLEGLGGLRALLHVRRGNTAFRAGDVAAAEREYQRALAIDPRHEEGLTNLVAVLQRTGRATAALQRLETFCAEHPASVFAFQLGARVAAQSGDRAAALRWIDRGLKATAATPDAAQAQALRELADRLRRR